MVKMFKGIFFLSLLLPKIINAETQGKSRTDRIIPVIHSSITQQRISKNGLSAIFKMRLRQWQDGSPISVFVLNDDHPDHNRFCKEILHVFPHQMRRAWNKLVFSGSGQAPITLESKEAMIKKILNTPGAIGYLSTTDISDEIKPLEIE